MNAHAEVNKALHDLHRLEDTLNELHFAAGEALRAAVRAFNREPLSISSVDAFRGSVLHIADRLAEPMPLPSRQYGADDDTAGEPGHNLRAPETLRVVR